MQTRFNQRQSGQPGGAPNGAASANPFAALDPNAGGERFPPLPYDFQGVVEIIKTAHLTMKGNNAVTELRVVDAETPGVTVGAIHSYVQPIGDKWGYGIAKFAKMVFAAGALDDAAQAEAVAEAQQGVGVMNAALGAAGGVAKYGENPLAGCKVRVYVTRGKSDGEGGTYRDHAWSPFE